MPVITEITDSFIERKNGKTNNAAKLKKWNHLNHVLNCKTTSCKGYKMIQKHLLELHKIDRGDRILVPADYQIESYCDAILTIICANSENCSVCLKLLDHLSCHNRYCSCNNYKDICYHQLHLRQTVEKSSATRNSFNMYNMQCSTSTKEKVKSLLKYYHEAITVVQGLKEASQGTDSSIDNSIENLVNDDSLQITTESTSSNKSSLENNKCAVSTSRINSESSKGEIFDSSNADIESTENNNEYAITPYQAQASQSNLGISHDSCLTLSGESLIGLSDEESDSDEPNSISIATNLGNSSFFHLSSSHSNNRFNPHYTTSTVTSLNNTLSISSDSDMMENFHSDSSLDFVPNRLNNIRRTMKTVKFSNFDSDESSIDCLTGAYVGPGISVSISDGSNDSSGFIRTTHNHVRSRNRNNAEMMIDMTNTTSNSTKKLGKQNVCDSLFSDESLIDDGDSSFDSDMEGVFHNNLNTKCQQRSRKRKNKSISTAVFSDESRIEYSDDDDDEGVNHTFNFNHTTSIDMNNHMYSTDESSDEDSSHRKNGGVLIVDVTDKDKSEVERILQGSSNLLGENLSSSSFKDSSKVTSTATSAQETSGIRSDSTDIRSRDIFSSTPLHSSEFDYSVLSSNCSSHGTKGSISTTNTYTDPSMPQLLEVSHGAGVHKQKHKKFQKKHVSTPYKKMKQQQKSHCKVQNIMISEKKNSAKVNTNNRKDAPSASTYSTQNNFSSKINKSKGPSFGGINYSYARNVLSQQNAKRGGKTIEKKKYQAKKPSPLNKNKKKMKLYDTSSWIESSNYDQLCHSDTKKY